jgi:16S rRNA (uracil1498-N3)-methyltransferase
MPGHFTFYCNKKDGDIAFFDEVESKHAIQVLRYAVGDEIHFTNGEGLRMRGVIESASKSGFQARVIESIQVERPAELHVLMAILKAGDRMEWACEKITELGGSSLTLFQSDHGERGKVNLDRMKKVALSAMKQSHGAWLPKIDVLNFKQAIDSFSDVQSKFIAYCGEGPKTSMSALHLPGAIMIGPEGDFSNKEIELSAEKGWVPLDLGKQILRTETAAVSVTAALRLR